MGTSFCCFDFLAHQGQLHLEHRAAAFGIARGQPAAKVGDDAGTDRQSQAHPLAGLLRGVERLEQVRQDGGGDAEPGQWGAAEVADDRGVGEQQKKPTGQKPMKDILFGTTVDKLRHKISIPLFIVKN